MSESTSENADQTPGLDPVGQAQPGTLVLGLLAAGAALAGALIGSLGGLVVADRQIDAARHDSLREERKAAYVETISHIQRLNSLLRALEKQSDRPQGEVDALVCPEVQRLRASMAELLLVGTDSVGKPANEALGQAVAWCSTEVLYEEKTRNADEFTDAFIRFTVEAREDLEV